LQRICLLLTRSQPNITAFLQALQQLGWTDGRNVKIDYRWPAGDPDKARKYAAELVALAPDIILTISAASLAPLLQATRTVPIVFVAVSDPVGAPAMSIVCRGRAAMLPASCSSITV